MNELEAATTDDLLDELQRRYPHLVFLGLREMPGESDAEDNLVVFKGGITTAVGLLQRGLAHMTAESNKELIDPDREPFDDED